MNGNKKRISAFLSILSLVVFVGMSSAWHAANREDTSSGLAMDVEVTPNLIIASSVENINKPDYLKNRVDFASDDAAPELNAATHGSVTQANATGLKFNTNPGAVDFSSGNSAGKALEFKDVPVFSRGEDEERYYRDYTVYIASNGAPFEISSLSASVYGEKESAFCDYHYAASVDFYVGIGSEALIYKDTLNLAGKSPNGAAKTEAIVLGGGANPVTVPYHIYDAETNPDNYITVLMRFYFDGALQKSAGQAYVYSENLSLEDFKLHISFKANE